MSNTAEKIDDQRDTEYEVLRAALIGGKKRAPGDIVLESQLAAARVTSHSIDALLTGGYLRRRGDVDHLAQLAESARGVQSINLEPLLERLDKLESKVDLQARQIKKLQEA